MKQKGLTLVELMIVVAILGILASIAIPSYQKNIQTSNRKAEGMPDLLSIMQAQENYFVNKLTYTTDLTKLNYPSNYVTSGGSYKITAGLCGSSIPLTQCVRLTATGQGEQAKDGTLTLDSTGTRTHNGKSGWPK